ncbi:hypothetical protein TNCV_2738821 [Trichonephila clavipes]|nr:hypothetical protein TNCV_2738821 [Trichonephila clavipes]
MLIDFFSSFRKHPCGRQLAQVVTNMVAKSSTWSPKKGKIGYCGAENINRGHHNNSGVFFSTMSGNVSDKVILVESLLGEKMELAFNSPT